jgi:hypothetical protein
MAANATARRNRSFTRDAAQKRTTTEKARVHPASPDRGRLAVSLSASVEAF